MRYQLKERWDIYINGRDGLRESASAMVTMWRYLFPACGAFAEALYEFLAATVRVLMVIMLPLLFWIAPITAIFTAHRILTDDEIRAQLRRDIHGNGRG